MTYIAMFALFCLIGSLAGAVPVVLTPYFFWGSLAILIISAQFSSDKWP